MTSDGSEHPLYLAALAREMRDDERVFAGAHQQDVVTAAYLARRLWAPHLKLWANGMPQLDSALDALRAGRGTYDGTLVAGRDATFWQARAFDDALRAPVVFAGGLQVDSRGNTNLVGIRSADGAWKLRGPGSAGLSSLTALATRFFIGVPVHDPRVLVERCAAVSVLGDPVARRIAGLPPNALVAVITPIARFEPSQDGLILTERAAGVSIRALAGRTGFRIRQAETVRERRPLSAEEEQGLAALAAASTRNAGERAAR